MQYDFTRFNGNDNMTEMTLNDIEYTIKLKSYLPGQRLTYIRMDQAGIHKILPFLPGPIKLKFIWFSPSALLAGPPQYHLVSRDKFPLPSAECCHLMPQRRLPGAQHACRDSESARPNFSWPQSNHD